ISWKGAVRRTSPRLSRHPTKRRTLYLEFRRATDIKSCTTSAREFRLTDQWSSDTANRSDNTRLNYDEATQRRIESRVLQGALPEPRRLLCNRVERRNRNDGH